MEKKTRKSVPRPNSGRRAVDGATDLVKVGVRLSAEQHAWVKANGNDGLRTLIQQRIEAEKVTGVERISDFGHGRVKEKLDGIDYGSLTSNQKRYWAKQCERHGIPVPEGLKQ